MRAYERKTLNFPRKDIKAFIDSEDNIHVQDYKSGEFYILPKNRAENVEMATELLSQIFEAEKLTKPGGGVYILAEELLRKYWVYNFNSSYTVDNFHYIRDMLPTTQKHELLITQNDELHDTLQAIIENISLDGVSKSFQRKLQSLSKTPTGLVMSRTMASILKRMVEKMEENSYYDEITDYMRKRFYNFNPSKDKPNEITDRNGVVLSRRQSKKLYEEAVATTARVLWGQQIITKESLKNCLVEKNGQLILDIKTAMELKETKKRIKRQRNRRLVKNKKILYKKIPHIKILKFEDLCR